MLSLNRKDKAVLLAARHRADLRYFYDAARKAIIENDRDMLDNELDCIESQLPGRAVTIANLIKIVAASPLLSNLAKNNPAQFRRVLFDNWPASYTFLGIGLLNDALHNYGCDKAAAAGNEYGFFESAAAESRIERTICNIVAASL